MSRSVKTNPVNIREVINDPEEFESNDLEQSIVAIDATTLNVIPTTGSLIESAERKDDDDDDGTTYFSTLTDFGPKKCGSNLLAKNDGEGAARYGIAEASHSKLNFEDDNLNINQFKIEFAFRTILPNGMLWVWANYNNYTRYFFLNIINGLLQLQVRGRKEPKILIYKSNKLNDGKWHDISMLKKGQEILLKVDHNPVQYLKDVPNVKLIRKRMYIGGVISKHRKQFNLTVPSFSGCI
ncbi:unnamed protein product, partial [Wuchereria bancrofti]